MARAHDTADQTLARCIAGGTLEQIFTTPVFSCMLPDSAALNAALASLVLAREASSPSVAKSNQGGWQSPPDFFDWEDPAVATLARCLAHALNVATARLDVPRELAIEFELFGWAAVNRRGHYNVSHIHPAATWSGVYYVDAGDAAAGAGEAALEFMHPVTAAAMTFFPGILPSARLVYPKSGLLVLFPGYLHHGVRRYDGERPRICVAFNAHLRSARAAP